MKIELIEKTYDLVDEIKELEVYKRYLVLHKEIEKSNDIQSLVQVFIKKRNQYEEAKQYGKYHPNLKQYQQELLQAKEDLYTQATIVEFKQCEKELQQLLDQVSSELAQAISKKIKHPNPIGLINKH